MDRPKLLEVVRTEFHKHRFDFYAESVPNSNRKVTVPGCPVCRVRAQTVSQYVDHLEQRVIAAVDREFSNSSDTANVVPFPVALHRIDPCPRKSQSQ